MKITNFRDYTIMPYGNPWFARARVDVTTGWWLWRKVVTWAVVRSVGGPWVSQHTGRLVPWSIHRLENTYHSEQRWLADQQKRIALLSGAYSARRVRGLRG